jgi:hypothetical protein
VADHGEYGALVDAATACVIGWPAGEAPAWAVNLARGLETAGLPAELLDEQLGAGWREGGPS